MNKRRLALLKFLLNRGSNDYKIIEVSHIFSKIKKYKNKFDLFEEDVNYLRQTKRIDLKYIDENNICFSILDSSILMGEEFKNEKKFEKKILLIFIIGSIFCGLMSFIGGFLANLIVR